MENVKSTARFGTRYCYCVSYLMEGCTEKFGHISKTGSTIKMVIFINMSKKTHGNKMMKTKFGAYMIFFPGIYTKVVTIQCDET